MDRRILFSVLLAGAALLVACDRDAPPIIAPEPVIYISLNEVFSQGTAADPDWIELYNSSTDTLDISGYKIYDSAGQSGAKPKKVLPAGSTIPALGLLIIVTDDTTASGFGLSSSGEQIWLEDSKGKVIDTVTFPALSETQSYGKTVEGSKEWKIWDQVTRGLFNNGSDVVILPLKLNEAESRGIPGTDPDWVEIYNPSNVAVSLNGYKIYDPGGHQNVKPKMEFPAGSSVPAKGFFVIVVDDTSAAGFGLSSGGDEIWLEDASGTQIDYVKIPALVSTTTSYCRIPDGADNWQISNTITRGKPNQP
ncbi:MAG TPA: lamin tail domain-containing protein [bacterium]|nr:lamin tail domain-containing protein [bacterium]HQG44065.1 lamin tail domain-containing protein [bacterium]HQI48737.1 lamin tail domain-containing protein [bacterium]HQJ65224.1 lamin tail domain-containing protein [bacterium]